MTDSRTARGAPTPTTPEQAAPVKPGTAVAPQRSHESQKLALVHHHMSREPYVNALRAVLPRYVTPDRVTRTTALALAKNPALLECSAESIAQSALVIATWGLEIGRTAHIVPYGSEAAPQADWKGMVELAMRGKSITSCRAVIVYSKDEIYVERGLTERLTHKPTWQENPGEPIAAYAIVRFPSGDQLFELMSKAEIERHRDRYAKAWKREKGKRGPWETEPLEMWRKTVVKRLLKYVPQNPLLAAALAEDEIAEGEYVLAEQATAALAGRAPKRVRGDGGYDALDEEPEPPPVAPNGQVRAEGGRKVPPTTVVEMKDKPKVRVPPPREGRCEHDVPLSDLCVECEADEAEMERRALEEQ